MLRPLVQFIFSSVAALLLTACGSSSSDTSTTTSTAIIGLAVNGNTLYLANADKQVIQALDLTTLAVTTVAGGAGVAGTTNGTGTAARFYEPFGLVFVPGAPDMLYVADTFNHGIRAINTTTNAVTTLSGTLGTSGATDGASTSALFNNPKGITFDGTSLIVADSVNYLIRTVNKTSGAVGTPIGTSGQSGYVDGVGAGVKFGNPFAVAATATYVYVSDAGNNSIRSVELTGGGAGTVATLAGSTSGTSGTTDNATAGQGTTARFNTPAGIATDGDFIYVADSGSHTIRMIEIATGKVSTIAGLAGTSGSADGTNGASARFNTPTGLALNATGTILYVSDQSYTKVRKIVLGTAPITFAAVTNTAVTVSTLNASF